MSEMKKRISRSRSCRAPQRKDPAAQYRGALNKALGARFEDRIADSLLFYDAGGMIGCSGRIDSRGQFG